MFPALLRKAAIRKQLNGALNELMPKMLVLDISTTPANVNVVWSEIKDFYLGGQNELDVNNPNSVQGFVNVSNFNPQKIMHIPVVATKFKEPAMPKFREICSRNS